MKAILQLFLACLILLVAACAASASDGNLPEIEKGNYWSAIAVAVAALAGICVVAFKSSKKTHLD